MNCIDKKCIIVIDKELPLGLIANTSAILGCSLGRYVEEIIGEDVIDKNNFIHKGIVNIPIPILSSTKDEIKRLYNSVAENYSDKINLIDFNDIAQKCKAYNEYIKKLSSTTSDELDYLGICMYGNKKVINSLVGSFSTLK